ncbi:MAG: hypothetical protein A2289_05580 [Deltaproteobacteria bacterium RIFOXYA12_FULL_58_15]|nr:MAG: hypothetical protein A2289_05580 [Deltaproteobacteria bacterium RIFOXYA12_FULL_58_15]OGR14639.1 MAG: hypothetical protein A2341_22150 [Deltaproteobacteria bacterium RIFOXYB12_FULL_58_9]
MTWQEQLDQAEVAMGDDRYHDALQLCDLAALQGDDARYHAALMRGDVLLQLGDALGALSSYDSVADPDLADAELDCCRGLALFELVRFAEADNALRSALRGQPNLAEAHFALGLIAEIMGTGRDIEYFRKARALAPELYPVTPQLTRNDFEAVVEEAMACLPEPVRQATKGIPILIADVVHPGDLLQSDPPLSPRVLGMFIGVPPTELSLLDAPSEQQPTILLFKRNLERACPSKDILIEEIRTTVLHEVGHAIGLDESALCDLGLE